MPFISDTEAKEIAKRIFSPEDYEDFVETMELMRHFEECVAEGKPSDRCKFKSLEENLSWCRLGLKIKGDTFEDYLQKILIFKLQGEKPWE